MKNAEEIIFVAKKNTPSLVKSLQSKLEENGIANLCFKPINKNVESLSDVMTVCDNEMNDSKYMGQPFLMSGLENAIDETELQIRIIPNGEDYISHITKKRKTR